MTSVHKYSIIYVRKGSITVENKINRLAALNEKFNGHLSSSDLAAAGFSKFDVSQFVKKGLLDRVSRGKYVHKDAMDDEFTLVQMNNSKMVFSNETALYLHNMTGRYPTEFSVTTESGYHLRDTTLKVFYVKPELLQLGVVELENYFGNKVLVYDKERTICDIIRNKNRIEAQVYLEGLQNYFLNGKPNLRKLSEYAKKLGMQRKVADLVQMYVKP